MPGSERRDVFDRDEGDAAPIGLLLGEEATDEGAVVILLTVERPALHGALQTVPRS
jgi:hypothetical protein